MKQKRCVELHIPHYIIILKIPAYDHSELASLYTVPLSAVNGLTKLTTIKGAGRHGRFD